MIAQSASSSGGVVIGMFHARHEHFAALRTVIHAQSAVMNHRIVRANDYIRISRAEWGLLRQPLSFQSSVDSAGSSSSSIRKIWRSCS